MIDYATARFNMVESQLRTNRVADRRVIGAFETVPRERFVPEHQKPVAYVDEDLKIGERRYLMEPMVLARLLEAAEIDRGDIALDVGCGLGYATALMARLAATVVALESDPRLAEQAEAALQAEGVDNAVVVTGPLEEGYRKQAPYNVILLNGAVAEVPKTVTDQLAEGGRLVTVVKQGQTMGRATLMERVAGVVSSRTLFDAATPWLEGFTREPGFVF